MMETCALNVLNYFKLLLGKYVLAGVFRQCYEGQFCNDINAKRSAEVRELAGYARAHKVHSWGGDALA